MTKDREEQLKNREVFISCVIPVHNEEDNIEPFILNLSKKIKEHTDQFEIIIIDDGSSDHTADIIKEKLLSSNTHIKYIEFSRNFGKENALTAGIDHAQGEITILIDSDFQHPLETIDTFLNEWAKGHDMVYGVRQSRKNEAFLKHYFTKFFYWFMKNSGEISLPTNAGDFRLLDRSVVDALKLCPERSRFMKGLYTWVGFKSKKIYYSVNNRHKGESSWHLMRLINLALTGITSFSDLPLRILGLLGLFISISSFFCALYVIVDTLIRGIDVPGYTTLLIAIIFFGGVQMLAIGVLGEYVSCIFREVKKRPKYIIAKKDGFHDEK